MHLPELSTDIRIVNTVRPNVRSCHANRQLKWVHPGADALSSSENGNGCHERSKIPSKSSPSRADRHQLNARRALRRHRAVGPLHNGGFRIFLDGLHLGAMECFDVLSHFPGVLKSRDVK